MPSYYEIPVIIPSYEPDEKLITLLTALQEAGIRHVIVVDDGSGTRYASFFERAAAFENCEVLRHAVNLGKGRALKTAFNHCLLASGGITGGAGSVCRGIPGCVTADSDGQHTPADILACMRRLWDNPESLILGCRDFDGPAVPARSSFGNKCTRQVFRYLLGLSVSDTQTGLRAIPAFFMEKLLEVKGERFEYETNMLIEAKNLNIRVLEVPVKTIYIEENKTSHFNPIRDSLRIYLVFGKFLFSSFSSNDNPLFLIALLLHNTKYHFFYLLMLAKHFLYFLPYYLVQIPLENNPF